MEHLKQQLVEISRMCYARGWSLATSGNFSVRAAADRVLITASSKDKSSLEPDDIVLVDLSGKSQDGSKPSAETILHCRLYQSDVDIGAVLHIHSLYSTVLSMRASDHVTLQNYEMLKALRGVMTHQHSEVIPIFSNQQELMSLGTKMNEYLQQHKDCHAILLRAHGLYTWGQDLAEARRHLEALEFLFECEYRRNMIEVKG